MTTVKFKRNGLAVHSPEEVTLPVSTTFTESGITPRSIKYLGLLVPTELPLEHGRHKGLERLCALVAEQSGLAMSDVIVTVGASTGIFIVQTALLSPGDHLVITRPNYLSNIEGPKSTGCRNSYVELDMADGFRVDVDRIAAAIQPHTRLISITNPSNPMGTSMTGDELALLAGLARSRGCYLLVDETYSDLLYEGRLPRAATLGPHVIGVSSMSKTFGVSGIRIGWITMTDARLQETFLAAKELINISVSVVDEALAEQILQKADELVRPTIAYLERRRDFVDTWTQSEELLEWIPPVAGGIGFVHLKRDPPGRTAAFYDRLLREQRTVVAQGA